MKVNFYCSGDGTPGFQLEAENKSDSEILRMLDIWDSNGTHRIRSTGGPTLHSGKEIRYNHFNFAATKIAP